jgi:predicted hydrocarbon binding protein
MKCNICERETHKSWKYCPECGVNIGESQLTHKGYTIERIKHLWTEKDGNDFYKNFKSVENMGTMPYTKTKPIRPTLGDFIGIHFSNIKVFSLQSIQPNCMEEVCDMYRMLGYYSADQGLKTMRLSRIIDVISKTGFFWKLLANNEVQKALTAGWRETNQAVIRMVNIDQKNSQITFEIEEGQTEYLKNKPPSFMDMNILCGNLEAVCDKKCIGKEEVKNGKTHFTYKLHPLDKKVEYPITYLTKDECDRIVEELVHYINANEPTNRTILEDKVHISGEQSETYFIMKTSEGHRIMEKYSGIKVGKKMQEEAGIEGETDAIKYLQGILKQEKAGMLHEPLKREDTLIIRMDESIYSSGVNNIHMKLDLFLAGIIEGMLSQATGKKWQVNETKCQANGNDYCEFACQREELQ